MGYCGDNYSDAGGLETRYNKLHISKLTPIIVDELESKEYLTQVKGHYSRTGGSSSHLSRMRATNKLIQLITGEFHVTPEMIELAQDTECIILRDYDEYLDRQVNVSYTDEDDLRIKQWRMDLCAYNNLLRRTYIDIPSCPPNGVPTRSLIGRSIKISQQEKFVRRIFNNGNWSNGGRFYGGWWQRIPESWRVQIRIGVTPVTEIDFSGLHIVLLYALEGISYKDDPYQLEGYEQSERVRTLLKLVLLASINAKDMPTAIMAVNKEINFDYERYGWVREDGIKPIKPIEDFADKHHAIKKYFFSNCGIRLQNIDSLIAEKVIRKFTDQDIPVLCVHDSFLIQSDKAEELKQVMQRAFEESVEEMGIDLQHVPRVSIDGLGLGQFRVMLSHPDWREVRDMLLRERYEYPLWYEKLQNFNAREIEGNYYRC